jgi:hypothetical protein
MNTEPSSELLVAAQGSPMNELPVPVVASISWRATGLVFAIPVLLVYTTGVEIMILFRARDENPASHPQSVSREFSNMRDWQKRLTKLRVNGAPVDVLGGQFFESGFNVRAWSAYSVHQANQPGNEMLFELDWPEFETASYTLPDVRREAMNTETLWPDNG